MASNVTVLPLPGFGGEGRGRLFAFEREPLQAILALVAPLLLVPVEVPVDDLVVFRAVGSFAGTGPNSVDALNVRHLSPFSPPLPPMSIHALFGSGSVIDSLCSWLSPPSSRPSDGPLGGRRRRSRGLRSRTRRSRRSAPFADRHPAVVGAEDGVCRARRAFAAAT